MLRIERMRTVNVLIQKLFKEARLAIIRKQKEDQKMYAELLKNLIIQGLIRLMEPEVNVRCRKSDQALVERVLEQAAEEYKRLMKNEVKAFRNKDVPLKIVLDTSKYLPEFQEGSENPLDSCMGGVLMHARRGRIVCSNTLDERLQLVYQEAIP